MSRKLQYYKAIVYSRTGVTIYDRVLSVFQTEDLTFIECRFGPVGMEGVAKIELIPTGEYSDAAIEDEGVRRTESEVVRTTTDGHRRQ